MRFKFCVISIFLLLSAWGSAFAGDINAFAEKTLGDFKNNNYEALYAEMSQAAKTAMPYNGMVDFFQEEKEILGKLQRYDKLDNMQQVTSYGLTTILRYAAYFEKTGAIIVLTIVEENGKPACQSLHIDSLVFAKPEIQERLKKFTPREK